MKAMGWELFQYNMRKSIKGLLRWSWRFLLKVVLILCVLTMVQVFLLRFLDPPATVRMAWDFLRHKIAAKQYEKPLYHWRELEEISSYLKKAVLAAEDQRFLSHHGFDFAELNQAVRDFLTAERTRGASTISMQVARTVFLWRGRSWFRKIAEAYYTVLIELMWSKERILEIYLNTVHWGKGIMGAEAASRKYFRTSSANITPSQAALLAAILPNPTKWTPIKPSKYVRERQKEIMRQMVWMPLP
jgi:monofunctional biosynthetic peptidoglycan transglycosylase